MVRARQAGSRAMLVVLATLVLLPAVTATGSSAAAPLAEQSGIDADTVLLRADLQRDGTAVWTVEYRIRLDDQNATEAFESVSREIESDPGAFRQRFADRMRRTVATAENATGRRMAVENVTVRTARQQLGQEYGTVIYTFEWIGFAAVDGSQLRAGDALAGLFLDRETSLVIGWPEGYHATTVDPEPHDRRERAVVWNGRIDFADGEPRVVLSAAPTATGSGADGGQNGEDGGDGGDGSQADGAGGGLSLIVVGLVAVGVLAVLGGAGWLYARRTPSGGSPADRDTDDGPPEELLSNEERVLKLLEANGGRMKQKQVAEELGWTAAKTSQVVGDLREADEIDAFRLGRENVLSLPEEDDV